MSGTRSRVWGAPDGSGFRRVLTVRAMRRILLLLTAISPCTRPPPMRTQWSVRPPVLSPAIRRRSTSSASTSAACSTRTTVRPSTAAGARSTGMGLRTASVAERLAPDFFNARRRAVCCSARRAAASGQPHGCSGPGSLGHRADLRVVLPDVQPAAPVLAGRLDDHRRRLRHPRTTEPRGRQGLRRGLLRRRRPGLVEDPVVRRRGQPAARARRARDSNLRGAVLPRRDVRPGRRGRARPDHLRQQADRRRRDRRAAATTSSCWTTSSTRAARRRRHRHHGQRPTIPNPDQANADGVTSEVTPATATTTTTASPMPKTPFRSTLPGPPPRPRPRR